MSDILTPQRVDDIARACLYRDEELTVVDGLRQVPKGAVLVEGVVSRFGFHPSRLAEHADEIRAMLAELPEQFCEGWSFLSGCTTKTGELWTGMQSRVETLFALGMGIGAVECCFPRDLWTSLPGGVPYYLVRGGAS